MGVKLSKACVVCDVVKPLDEFHRNAAKKDGRQPTCRVCACAATARHRAGNSEDVRLSKAAYYRRNKERIEARKKEAHRANPEKKTAQMSRWYARNREHSIERAVEWKRRNPSRAFDRYLRRRYGIDSEDWARMFNTQNGKCAGCRGALAFDITTHVDHNHATKKVRGLLCQQCNRALGLVYERSDTLLALVRYLDAA